MSNIKFTYLKIADARCSFCFIRLIQNIQKQPHKRKLHSAKYSNYNIQFNHNTNLILITGFYTVLTVAMLGILSCQEGKRGLKLAQAHYSLQNNFASCLVLVPCVGLSHIFTPPRAGLANSGRCLYFFNERNI